MENVIKLLLVVAWIEIVNATIDGLSYLDPIKQIPYDVRRDNPCNPLYWYPRAIPSYCYVITQPPAEPEPVTEPPTTNMPLPPPVIFPVPPINPMPMMPIPIPLPIPLPVNMPYLPAPPLPQMGMVPGLPGIVSNDGGINLLPFSDVYADVLEKHKNKMLRKKLRKLIRKYESYPYRRNSRLDE